MLTTKVAELQTTDIVKCPSQANVSHIYGMKTVAFSFQIQICKPIVLLIPREFYL